MTMEHTTRRIDLSPSEQGPQGASDAGFTFLRRLDREQGGGRANRAMGLACRYIAMGGGGKASEFRIVGQFAERC